MLISLPVFGVRHLRFFFATFETGYTMNIFLISDDAKVYIYYANSNLT